MDNLLTWNVRNWITVMLMFLLGWIGVMLIGRVAISKLGGGSSQPAPQSGFPMLA